MIKATIIADSLSPDYNRITSFELEMPRFIWAEMLTHRLFSRNAASSRAIPVAKILDQVRNDPAMPSYWGASQSGMQAGEEIRDISSAKVVWQNAAYNAAEESENLHDLGLHKQHANRITEPFQHYKVVLTATEFDNFFHLRNHPDAQPEIQLLAQSMLDALSNSTPKGLSPGEWHLPYITTTKSSLGITYTDVDGTELTLEQALKVSSSCCAQVSYRVLDHSLSKAEAIYDKLVFSTPVHASPFEHQATPMNQDPLLIRYNNVEGGYFEEASKFSNFDYDWQDGVTHMDRNGNYWSGNFQGWIQHRQLIANNYCDNYDQ